MILDECLQRWLETRWGPSISWYLATVRGDTRICNFNISSFAIRSSPQVGFSRSIFRISILIFFGRAGRPEGRDFHRQKRRNAWRCHRKKVSGLTIISASRQAISLPSPAIVHRIAIEVETSLRIAFIVQGELLSQEQVLSGQCCARFESKPREPAKIHMSLAIKNGKNTVS